MPSVKKILVIEDDDLLRHLIVKKLEREKFQALAAADGQEGLQIIEREKPDLILLDIILPGVDGFEILKILKANDTLKNLPVIILSNLGEQKYVDQGLQMGVREYIVKAHHTLDEVTEKIHAVIDGQRRFTASKKPVRRARRTK